MLGATSSLTVEYMSSFLIAIGTYPIVPQDVAWNANNIGGSTKRAVGIAMHLGFVRPRRIPATTHYRCMVANIPKRETWEAQ